MPYSLSFLFVLLYLLMCQVLPLRANLAQWDLILEPIAQIRESLQSQENTQEESMESMILNQLKQNIRERYHLNGNVVLTPITHWNIKKPVGNWNLEWMNAPKRLTSTMQFNIRIMCDGKVYATHVAWGIQIEHRMMCLAAKHNLVSQIAVDFDDFKCEERDILNCRSTPFPINAHGAFRLKRRLNANEILCEDAIERQSLVTKGKPIDVLVKKGYLTLNLKGIALSSGDLNEIILVKNISNNKTFHGKIINENTVQVVF